MEAAEDKVNCSCHPCGSFLATEGTEITEKNIIGTTISSVWKFYNLIVMPVESSSAWPEKGPACRADLIGFGAE
ncbi:MAG: hypothetical protein JL50_13955 [Peptococcaceae bacterium BICA1-7]|nr:MAG: hypothetical protein JL50_13955 [Peptococcaceae bacterium BICA1-7]HBV96457.1 hypothetical protein [Desulfotomaculum sp.]